MKGRMKKLAALFLTVVMSLSVLTGCGAKDEAGTAVVSEAGAKADAAEGGASAEGKTYNGVDVSEHVDLKMYLLGERTPDFDAVYAEVNKILEEKLNCSISVDFLSWGEHDTKYSLLFSSQEDFDLIFTASGWAHYEQTVALGGFYPLEEDFIKTYAPNIWEVVPAVAWSQAKIDGVPYMVPNYQNEFGQDVIAVRGDLMAKYGFEDITSWEDLKAFYMACAADGMYASNGGPFYQYFQNQGMTMVSGISKELVLYNMQNPDDLDFYYILDWPGFKEYCYEVKEMADAGCWSPDVLTSTDERQTGLLTGRTAGMIWNTGSCATYAKEANAANPDWNVTICDPVASQPKKVNSYINNGVAINVTSKNPERAMMVLNELYTNQELNDLTRFGIEGKHWEAVGDDQYKVLDSANFGVDNNCNWGWMNADIKREEYIENRTPLDDRLDELGDKFEANIKVEHVYDGFSFNPTNVSTQVAAVDAVISTYYEPLTNGLVADVDQSFAEMKEALEQAGINDVLAELERQASEYVAAKAQ